eukprot:scaffold26152_cov126-Isochrysis_galbana.AAC.4
MRACRRSPTSARPSSAALPSLSKINCNAFAPALEQSAESRRASRRTNHGTMFRVAQYIAYRSDGMPTSSRLSTRAADACKWAGVPELPVCPGSSANVPSNACNMGDSSGGSAFKVLQSASASC